MKIYGEVDDAIPSSLTTKLISLPLSVQKLRRYINKIEKSLNSIKDILDEASPDLICRIKIVNQGSLVIANLGELYRESFVQVREAAKHKNQKKTKRQVKAVGALYIKDANHMIKRRHEGDLMKIHKRYILGERQPGEEEAAPEPQNLGYFFDTTGNR